MKEQASGSDKNVFVGIDFGTTKTMVASYDAGKKSPKPLTMGRGKFEKPTSMYATEAGELLFGDDADDEGITDLPNHIRRFKMKLGKTGLAHMGRKSGTAQQLTSEFLEHLKKQLEGMVFHDSVDRVILTVPAMFGPAQRHDLTAAARQAGFSQVELLEEPVAAGIAYCDQQSDLSKQLRFIVVDWGGGTFDVAHLERFSSGEIRVHEDFVVGLDDIGGEAFDDQLWNIASDALGSLGHGTLDSQPRENWGRYRRDLSRAKENLSSQASVSMTFALTDGKPAKISLNREDFNNIISPMIQKAASFVSELIVRAHNAGCPAEFILLAGGTSRIPLIGQELERITGVKCRQWSDGREAIALGAAIRANQLWGNSLPEAESKRVSAPTTSKLSKEEQDILEKVKTLTFDGRYEEAFSIITEMLIHQPSDEVFFVWNEVACAVPDGEAVLARSREVHTKRAADFWGAACVAASLAGLGRFQEAERISNVTEQQETATACFLKTLNPDDADRQSNLDKAFQKHPNHPWFLAEQAIILGEKGEPDAGIEMARKAVEIAPFSLSCQLALILALKSDRLSEKYDIVRIMERMSSLTFISRFGRLLWLIESDPSHSQINDLFEKVLNDPRANSGGKSALATFYALRARLRDFEKDQKQIMEDLNQAITICPTHVDARIARGLVLNSLERPEDAMRDFDAALQTDPESIEARLAKADCLLWKIDHKAAVAEYKHAFLQDTANIDAKSGLILSVLYKHFLTGVVGSSFLAPEISDDKRANAIASYGNPAILEDLVFFLWDKTFWGSASKGIMIGINGIVSHDEKGRLGIEFESIKMRRDTHALTITGKGIPNGRSIFIRANDDELRILNPLHLALTEIAAIRGV
jgi:actin-like ATPase involved in cell morphogenesis/Tfp pilus assembly protein PilF